jgi:hypothetical protein
LLRPTKASSEVTVFGSSLTVKCPGSTVSVEAAWLRPVTCHCLDVASTSSGHHSAVKCAANKAPDDVPGRRRFAPPRPAARSPSPGRRSTVKCPANKAADEVPGLRRFATPRAPDILLRRRARDWYQGMDETTVLCEWGPVNAFVSTAPRSWGCGAQGLGPVLCGGGIRPCVPRQVNALLRAASRSWDGTSRSARG